MLFRSIVLRAKGELIVKLFRNSNEVLIDNGAVVNVNVICEEYSTLYGGTNRTYYNNIYSADDYYLQFENISQGSQLGLLSYRKYVPSVTGDNRFFNPTYAKGSLATYVNSNDELNPQQDNQFVWIEDTSGTEKIYYSGATWDSNGLGKVLYSKLWNVGYLSGQTVKNVFSDINWNVSVTPDDNYTEFPVTVHPYIENIQNYIYSDKGGVKLINPNTKFTLPIKIFFKLSGVTADTIIFPSTMSTSPYVTKKLRIFVEPENLNRPFEFEVIFKISRNRTYNMRSSANVVSIT